MIAEFFRAWVNTKPDLRDTVEDRIYPQVADPKSDYPKIVFNSITNGRVARHLGGPGGLNKESIQFDIIDADYARAKAIELMILGGESDRRLDGYSVTRGDDVLAGITVREARWLDTRDGYDEPTDGEAQGPRRIQLDFEFTYESLVGTETIAGRLNRFGDQPTSED